MQLDKNSMERLLKMDDAALWTVIRTIAAQSGIRLPASARPEELNAIRRALGTATDADLSAATALLKKYREKNGG